MGRDGRLLWLLGGTSPARAASVGTTLGNCSGAVVDGARDGDLFDAARGIVCNGDGTAYETSLPEVINRG